MTVAHHINSRLSRCELWVSISNLAHPSWLPIDMRDAPCLPVKGFQGDHTTTNKCVMKYAALRSIWSQSQLKSHLREHKESK